MSKGLAENPPSDAGPGVFSVSPAVGFLFFYYPISGVLVGSRLETRRREAAERRPDLKGENDATVTHTHTHTHAHCPAVFSPY